MRHGRVSFYLILGKQPTILPRDVIGEGSRRGVIYTKGKGRGGEEGPCGARECGTGGTVGGWLAGCYVQCLSPQERTLWPSVRPSSPPQGAWRERGARRRARRRRLHCLILNIVRPRPSVRPSLCPRQSFAWPISLHYARAPPKKEPREETTQKTKKQKWWGSQQPVAVA